MPSLSTLVQISGEGSALSSLPYSKLHFHIPLFWRMRQHLHFPVLADPNLQIESRRNHVITVTLNSPPFLIEIALHTVDALITWSRCRPLCQHKCWSWFSFLFFCRLTKRIQPMPRKSSMNNLSISSLAVFTLEAFVRFTPAPGCLGFTPASPLLLHLSSVSRF